jgi:fructose-1,6-bisphosphatase/inositol monophosphatase family enzyme
MVALTLDDLASLARTAGAMIRHDFRFEGIHRDFKSDGSPNITPVTESDKRVNRFVIEALREKASRTELSITGEEESDESAQARVRVFVDPIDGTFPFAAGIPVSTFMLAVVEDGTPRLSVIYDPFGDQMFLAEKGKGATLNGNRIRVGDWPSLSNKTIVGSVWWNTAPYNIGVLSGLLPTLEDASVINLLSIGYMASKVATGEFAATLFPGSNAHDTAAAHLLVEEAGGVVTDVFGAPIDYARPLRGHIAANKAIHGRLVQLVRRFNP